jgi:hypothetical protein
MASPRPFARLFVRATIRRSTDWRHAGASSAPAKARAYAERRLTRREWSCAGTAMLTATSS